MLKYNNIQRAKLGLPPEQPSKKVAKTAFKKPENAVSKKRFDEFTHNEREQIIFAVKAEYLLSEHSEIANIIALKHI